MGNSCLPADRRLADCRRLAQIEPPQPVALSQNSSNGDHPGLPLQRPTGKRSLRWPNLASSGAPAARYSIQEGFCVTNGPPTLHKIMHDLSSYFSRIFIPQRGRFPCPPGFCPRADNPGLGVVKFAGSTQRYLLSPSVRHFLLSLSVPSCYNPIEIIPAAARFRASKSMASKFRRLSQWPSPKNAPKL
jgi:hypothetical protein